MLKTAMDNSPKDAEIPAAALITAAGTSFRFGASQKKEFFPLRGETVLHHTMAAFVAAGIFDYFCLTFLAGKEDETRQAVGKKLLAALGDRLILVPGGETRQDSVRLGLAALEPLAPGLVLIHDGARPWVSREIIAAVYAGVLEKGAAAPVVPSVDAMKTVDPAGRIKAHLDRGSTMAVQTPQGFLFPEILRAHRQAQNDGRTYIDDTEIYHRYCGEVFTVPGELGNAKITYPRDLEKHQGEKP